MPLFEENNQKNNTNQTDGLDTQTKPDPQQKPSSLLTTIGSLLPFAPLVFEQFTGQKVPQLSGTMADIQMALNNLQLAQSQIINQQNQLVQRLSQLETNAVQQLTSLSQQFQSLRLTHTREKKEIEYSHRPELNTEDQNY